MKKTLVIAAIGLAAFGGSAALADVDYETMMYGGGGGAEFLDDGCTIGWAKGFNLRAGRVIDRIGLRCTDTTGQRVEDRNAQYGGSGGTAYRTTCASGFVLKGIRGRAARLVDRIQMTCVKATDVNPATDPVKQTIDTDYPSFGGTGGSYFAVSCRAGDAAVGIQGAAAARLDRIGLLCKDTPNI